MPSLTLLGQSLLSGLFIGGLYGLLGLGLSLSWGLLRLINLAHFALVFLGAYLTYHLAAVGGINPFLAMLLIVPGFFGIGVALQAAFTRFRVGEFASLLVTFGITVVIESRRRAQRRRQDDAGQRDRPSASHSRWLRAPRWRGRHSRPGP